MTHLVGREAHVDQLSQVRVGVPSAGSHGRGGARHWTRAHMGSKAQSLKVTHPQLTT